jgi:hypothetical protein
MYHSRLLNALYVEHLLVSDTLTTVSLNFQEFSHSCSFGNKAAALCSLQKQTGPRLSPVQFHHSAPSTGHRVKGTMSGVESTYLVYSTFVPYPYFALANSKPLVIVPVACPLKRAHMNNGESAANATRL